MSFLGEFPREKVRFVMDNPIDFSKLDAVHEYLAASFPGIDRSVVADTYAWKVGSGPNRVIFGISQDHFLVRGYSTDELLDALRREKVIDVLGQATGREFILRGDLPGSKGVLRLVPWDAYPRQ